MYDHHSPDITSDNRQSLFALNELIGATRALAEMLKQAAESLHAEQKLTMSERSLLLELKKRGPTTVPALARNRNVSRQYIQSTANPLLASGILVTKPNPAHRRSRFLDLTPQGLEMIREAMRKEGGMMKFLVHEFDAEEVRQAAQTIAKLKQNMQRVID